MFFWIDVEFEWLVCEEWEEDCEVIVFVDYFFFFLFFFKDFVEEVFVVFFKVFLGVFDFKFYFEWNEGECVELVVGVVEVLF